MQRSSNNNVVLSQREYKKYQTSNDYSKGNLQIGATAIAGRQSHIMIDFLSTGMEEVKGFERLTKEQQEIALLLTFDELQQTVGNELEAGATGCLTISYVDKSDTLHTAVMNLGPGFAYSVIGSTTTQFNTPAHTTLDFAEINRITDQGGLVFDRKLSGKHHFTRAFSYKSVDTEGLSHMPEILFSEKKRNGETAQILLSNHPLEEEKIGDIFQKQATKTPVMLSSQLVDASFATGIKENIVQGVMVPDDSTTVSMSLFRGISESKVSEALSKKVYPILQQKIQALLDPDPKIQAAYVNRVRVLKMAFYFRQGDFSYFKEAYEHDQKAVEAELNKLEIKESIKQKIFFQALAQKETQYIAACLLTQWWSYHELKDEDGNTPLMHAARLGNESLVSRLLAANVDLDVTNNAGETALMLAKNYPNIVKKLSPPPLEQKKLPPKEGQPQPAGLTDPKYQKIAVESDYSISLTKDKLKIGGCAIKGRTPRPETESYLKIGIDEIAGFETLTEEDQKIALLLTFDDLQQKVGNQKQADASACVAITYYDKKTDLQHTVVAYLGDTVAHKVKIPTVGETKHLQLNERLLVSLPSEAKRLNRDEHGVILKDLSRALGATDSERLGLSHVPEVKHFTVKCDGSTIFTLVGAGLDILSKDQFIQTVKRHHNQLPSKIASELVDQDFKYYITQNQVQGVMISEGHTMPAALAVVSSKHDSAVSKPASEQVYAILKNNIQLLCDPSRAVLQKMAFYAKQGELNYLKEALDTDRVATEKILENLSESIKETLFFKALKNQETQYIAEYFLTDTTGKPAWPFYFHRDDKEYQTPLDWARRYNNTKLMTFLFKKNEVDCVLKVNQEKTQLIITFNTPEEAELFLQKISATKEGGKSLKNMTLDANKLVCPLRIVGTKSNPTEYAIDLGDHQFVLNLLAALNLTNPKSNIYLRQTPDGASFQLRHSFNDGTFNIHNRVPGYAPKLEAKSESRFYQEESIYLKAESPLFSEEGLTITEGVSLADFNPLPAPWVSLTDDMHAKMTYRIIEPPKGSFFDFFFSSSSSKLPDIPHITLTQNASGNLVIAFDKKPELLATKYLTTGDLGEGYYAFFSSHEKMLEFLKLFNYKMNPFLESVCKPSVGSEPAFLYFPKDAPIFKKPGTILQIYLPLDSPALKPIEPSRNKTSQL